MKLDKSIFPPGWTPLIEREFSKSYMTELSTHIQRDVENNVKIWPVESDVFKAYQLTDLEQTRIVVLGQDPYPTPGFAHGLSFSVNDGVRIPASLKNIFTELERDLGVTPPASGNLEAWARQGVLLLNTILTVVERQPKSHQRFGWERFTAATIEEINKLDHGVVFLAWGGHAHEVCELVDETKHKVIRTSHPSNMRGACKRSGITKSGKPYQAFVSSGCFSQANDWLVANGHDALSWKI
ncbi:uracil-DNA glycosylase [Vibrio alginolyticus]